MTINVAVARARSTEQNRTRVLWPTRELAPTEQIFVPQRAFHVRPLPTHFGPLSGGLPKVLK